MYVTGYSGLFPSHFDCVTIKYNPAGDTVWLRRFPGYGGNLVLDQNANLIISGSRGGNFITTKYDPNGNMIWQKDYKGLGVNKDGPLALTVDGEGCVYVTGLDYDFVTLGDYLTIKYTSMGDTVWVRRYNGPGNGYDRPSDVGIDGNGNVYVTGSSTGIEGILTIQL